MLPDPWTLATTLAVALAGPQSAAEHTDSATALQAEADPAPAAEPPSAEPPAAEAPPAEPPAAEAAPDPTEPAAPPPADGAPATPPSESVGSFPDAAGAPPASATEPAPPPAEERTWNDPTAATAAAAAAPSTARPPEDDLGAEPLEPASGKDPKGFGMAMVGAITFSPDAGHAWADGACPVADINGVTFNPGCTATPAAGVSAEGRFGYMFGMFGAELYGQLAIDYVNARLDQVPNIPGIPDYATQMHLGRLGIGGGAMGRFKTPPGSFRLSTGAGVGFLYRTIFSNVSSLDGSFQDYAAPVLRADVGIVIVSALTLGIMGWVEFAPTVTVRPDFSAFGPAGEALEMAFGDTVAYSGTQGFIGLFGGFAFGK